ncbi:hypothetical protein V6N11_025490 [Hibiscus sabdariffa]|uniref:Uncharacterized protein n=1 Tax=Hibiscus sabdariffa TaxID=183260 RepID=A0ABR2NIH6_9ROSI
MSDSPVDPHLLKKQRRRDESLPDSPIADSDLPHAPMDCDSSKQLKPQASYKDLVTGSSDVHSAEEFLPLDDDDIDLLEDDVSIGESEGIPFIVFSDRVQSLALKSMDYTLVVKVLGHGFVERSPPSPPEPPVPPQDLYGPWMLVEKRKRRQQKQPVALQSMDSDFHVESSRFNPIFVDSNDDDNQVNTVDSSPIPVEVPSESTGKAGVQIRKPPIFPLGTRKSNMPGPRHLDVSMSSSRGARSRAPTSILNPKKHAALSIPILAGPTAGAVSSPATNRSSSFADMVPASNLSTVAAIQGNNNAAANGPGTMSE